MSIKAPNQRVYYYECSYGSFRLTYFIPYRELGELVNSGDIKEQVLEDFPDGVDLRVGETDYQDFYEVYGYRPKVDPDVARGIFFSILSSTRNWKKFQGSDIISAKDLEDQIDDLDRRVKEEKDKSLVEYLKTPQILKESIPMKLGDLQNHREIRKRISREQREVDSLLRKIKPRGIDRYKTLQNQSFSQIQWTEGENIEEVFSRIQRRGRRKN